MDHCDQRVLVATPVAPDRAGCDPRHPTDRSRQDLRRGHLGRSDLCGAAAHAGRWRRPDDRRDRGGWCESVRRLRSDRQSDTRPLDGDPARPLRRGDGRRTPTAGRRRVARRCGVPGQGVCVAVHRRLPDRRRSGGRGSGPVRTTWRSRTRRSRAHEMGVAPAPSHRSGRCGHRRRLVRPDLDRRRSCHVQHLRRVQQCDLAARITREPVLVRRPDRPGPPHGVLGMGGPTEDRARGGAGRGRCECRGECDHRDADRDDDDARARSTG